MLEESYWVQGLGIQRRDLGWKYTYKIICIWVVVEDVGWMRSSKKRGCRRRKEGLRLIFERHKYDRE